jgi:hypothetical protein
MHRTTTSLCKQSTLQTKYNNGVSTNHSTRLRWYRSRRTDCIRKDRVIKSRTMFSFLGFSPSTPYMNRRTVSPAHQWNVRNTSQAAFNQNRNPLTVVDTNSVPAWIPPIPRVPAANCIPRTSRETNKNNRETNKKVRGKYSKW